MRRVQIIQALGLIHEDAQTVRLTLIRHAQVETNTLILRAYTNALKNYAPSSNSISQFHP
jgi:hypothetical protein